MCYFLVNEINQHGWDLFHIEWHFCSILARNLSYLNSYTAQLLSVSMTYGPQVNVLQELGELRFLSRPMYLCLLFIT